MGFSFQTTILVVLVSLVAVGYSSSMETQTSKFNSAKKIQEESKAKSNSDTRRGALGQGFDIHKIDLLSKELQATGAKIFESIDPDDCAVTDKVQRTQKDDTYFSSTKSLYSSLASTTNVNANINSAYTFGASVGAVTNNIVSGNYRDFRTFTESQGL